MHATAADLKLENESQLTELLINDPLRILNSRFEHFYALVLGYLVNRLFDRELAEELTAQTFYKAATSIKQTNCNTRQIEVWLLRTATNLANTHYRRKQLHGLLLGRLANEKVSTTESDSENDDQQHERIRSIIKTLPPKYQSVVVLRYYQQMSFEQIAAIANCREETVRTRLSRAIKQIRRRLGLTESIKA
ncbi:MAG: RNA polymerase sigma factor [Planctomycetota bacterium]|jgi:RNA polymerase sigma-70 factor (ECF subfamily)